MDEPIGKVSATEKDPSSCTELRFWVKQDVIVRPFDIVKAEHLSKTNGGKSASYAMVQDLLYKTDSAGDLASFVSSDFGDVSISPLNQRLGTTIGEAEVLYNNEDIEMPVRDGSR
jgi:hypothetical protein